MEVLWLSYGMVLSRVFYLHDELQAFLTLQEHEFAHLLADDEWIAKLAYLSSIFVHLNELNRKMEGQNENIMSSMDKIQIFHRKLKFWLQRITSGSTDMFPTVCLLAAGNKLIYVVEEHINALQVFGLFLN
jgi:uncharacterized membrane protein